jgi:hypothetical protein
MNAAIKTVGSPEYPLPVIGVHNCELLVLHRQCGTQPTLPRVGNLDANTRTGMVCGCCYPAVRPPGLSAALP